MVLYLNTDQGHLVVGEEEGAGHHQVREEEEEEGVGHHQGAVGVEHPLLKTNHLSSSKKTNAGTRQRSLIIFMPHLFR